MIIHSVSLGRDIDTTDITTEELEAMYRDYESPEFKFAAPGVRRAYEQTFRREYSCYGEETYDSWM